MNMTTIGSSHVYEASKKRLDEHADRLFCKETTASLQVLQLGQGQQGLLLKSW